MYSRKKYAHNYVVPMLWSKLLCNHRMLYTEEFKFLLVGLSHCFSGHLWCGSVAHILVVTWAFVICLIRMPSGLGTVAVRLRGYISGKSLMSNTWILILQICIPAVSHVKCYITDLPFLSLAKHGTDKYLQHYKLKNKFTIKNRRWWICHQQGWNAIVAISLH